MSAIVECPTCDTRNRVPVSAASGHPRCPSCKNPLPWLVDAGDADFDAAIDASVPVLVDLWAPWCGPCRMVAPGVEAAAHEFAGRFKAVKVNVDDSPGVANRFRVQGIPALFILRDGEIVDRHVGALGPDALHAWIAPHVPVG